jgi:hypothetical protein
MKLPRPGGQTTERFDRLAETFVARGARRGQMFGMPVLKVGDKVFAGTYGDAMTFKLGPDDLEKALKAKGVEPFEPGGRRMKEWALVPVEHSRQWARLADQAFMYLSKS